MPSFILDDMSKNHLSRKFKLTRTFVRARTYTYMSQYLIFYLKLLIVPRIVEIRGHQTCKEKDMENIGITRRDSYDFSCSSLSLHKGL